MTHEHLEEDALALRPRWAARWSDGRLALLLFIVAVLFGMSYLAVWTNPPEGYWQAWWLAPSVMMATGHGFVYPEPAPQPLLDFMNRKVDRLSANAIPFNTPVRDISFFHEGHRYLLYAVALVWRLFGVSWKALLPLYGVLCGISVVAAYGVFRLGMNRLFACFLALLFMLSPAHLSALPLLRDYGKAPFMLAAIFVMGWIIARPMSRARLLGLSALLGLWLGIGRGFRMDVLVCVPAAALVLAAFIPGAFRGTLRLRLAAVLVLLVSFEVAAWPILHPKASAKTSAHHVLGGFVEPYDVPLGIGITPYTWMPVMNDLYMFSYVESQARIFGKAEGPMPYQSPAYQKAGLRYLSSLITQFPGDAVTRMYASVLRILEQSPTRYNRFDPDDLREGDDFVRGVWGATWPLLAHLARFAPLYAALALLFLSAGSLRLGVAALFMLFYFGGYSCLQFCNRHYFHMSILPFWAFGFVVNGALFWAAGLGNAEKRRRLLTNLKNPMTWWRPPVKRLLVFAAGAIVVIAAPLAAARLIQHPRVMSLYERYSQAELEPLDVERVPDSPRPGLTLLKPAGLFGDTAAPGRESWQTHPEVLVIEVEDAPGNDLWFWPRYAAPVDTMDFTYYPRKARLFAPNGGTARRFLPVFEAPDQFFVDGGATLTGGRKFEGLAVLSDSLAHVKNVYRVKDPAQLGLIMELSLAEDWRSMPWHQTLQPYPLPAPVRACAAHRDNLLRNGGMERWDAGSELPALFYPPGDGSSVAKEEGWVVEGQFAAKQTWARLDPQATFDRRFHAMVSGLEPDTLYEFYVKAKNPSKGRVVIDAWQQLEPGKFARIATKVVAIAPGANFEETLGQFRTPPGKRAAVLFSAYLPGDTPADAFPLTIYWDDWRLVPAPDYGEVRRW